MKKFVKIAISFCFAIILCFAVKTPYKVSFADEIITPTIETVYPEGISHYVDLNNVEGFCVNGDEIFYVTLEYSNSSDKFYSIHKFDPNTNISQTLFPSADENGYLQNFAGMYAIDGYVLVLGITPTYFLWDCTNNQKVSTAQITPSSPYYLTTIDDKIMAVKVYEETEEITTKQYIGVAIYDSANDFIQNNHSTSSRYDLTTLSVDNVTSSRLAASNSDIYMVTNDNNISHFSVSNTYSISHLETKNMSTLADMRNIFAFEYDGQNYVSISTHQIRSIFDSVLNDQTTTTHFASTYDKNYVYVSGDKFYFYNSVDCNIKSYDITKPDKIALTDEQAIVMGKGSQVGRFDGVNSLQLKCKEYVFVSDKNNGRIQVIKQDNTIETISLNEADQTGYFASSLMLGSDNTLYYIKTNGSSAYLCGENIFTDREIQPIAISTNICDATISDIDDIIYMLDYSQNSIVVIDTKNSFAQSTIDNLPTTISINANSKIGYLSSGTIVLSANNLLYKIKLSNPNFTYNNSPMTFSSDIAGISASQADNNVLVCFDSSSEVVCVNFETNAQKVVNFGAECDICSVCVSAQDGTVFAFDKNASRIVYFLDTTLVKGFDSYTPYKENALNTFGSQELASYATLAPNSFVYEYTYFKGNHDVYTEDKNVLVLDNLTSQTFTYILYVDGDELKLGYVENNALEYHTATADMQIVLITTTNNTPVYKYPTVKGNIKIHSIDSINTVINALGKYPVSIDGVDGDYYIVKLADNSYGYILSSYLTQNTNISQKFSANATVKIYDYSDSVNVYADEDKLVITGSLSNGQRVYVETLDKSKELTYIKYLDDENNIRVGYIDTKYLTDDGMSPIILTAIILFCISLLVVVALITWYVIFKKKQKKDSLAEQENEKANKDKLKVNKNKQKENTEDIEN